MPNTNGPYLGLNTNLTSYLWITRQSTALPTKLEGIWCQSFDSLMYKSIIQIFLNYLERKN